MLFTPKKITRKHLGESEKGRVVGNEAGGEEQSGVLVV